jgi:Cu-Zn family superoxide dismutase
MPTTSKTCATSQQRRVAGTNLAAVRHIRETQETAMNGKILVHCAALLGAAALIAGCAPDDSERGGSDQARPGNGAQSRNGEAPNAAGRDTGGSIRPPTTTTSPAAPGAAPPAAGAPPAATPRLMARADIRPLGDNTARGIVEFQTAAGDSGPMTIHVMLMGLDAGPHGMHVHMGTDCEAPGEHLNPQSAPHGPANAASGARHLGDLGNVTADASGMVEEMLRDAMLGSDPSFIGKVLVVHKGQDDLSTQPDGDSGDPIACGVIEQAEQVISRGDDPNRAL